MQRFTRLGAALALGLGLAVRPLAAAPASAHGEEDRHRARHGRPPAASPPHWSGRATSAVEESAVVVIRAVSDAGDEVGPITLVSASKASAGTAPEPAVLDEGRWTVTARVKEPAKAKVETEVDVVAPPAAEQAEPEQARARDVRPAA